VVLIVVVIVVVVVVVIVVVHIGKLKITNEYVSMIRA